MRRTSTNILHKFLSNCSPQKIEWYCKGHPHSCWLTNTTSIGQTWGVKYQIPVHSWKEASTSGQARTWQQRVVARRGVVEREGLRVRWVCALAAHCEVFWPLTGGLFLSLSLALSRALDTCALGKRVGGVCDPACTNLHATGKCQGAIIGGGCGDRRTTESIRRRQTTEFPSKNSCTEVLSPHSMHSSAPWSICEGRDGPC